ncbi:hypothetical protein ACCT20_36945, partial [Rhizobium ruizarguesonis]
AFLQRAGYSRLRGRTWDEAVFLADDWFKYFNYRSLAHLCAGIDYIFGPEGKLVPNLVKPGKGEPKASYDPQNPYLRLPPCANRMARSHRRLDVMQRGSRI